MVGWIVLAVVILPFVLGYWVGHPWFAGAAFGALALTVLLEASGTDNGAPEGFAAGMALGLLASAASAAAGGWVRARQRRAAEARREPTDRR